MNRRSLTFRLVFWYCGLLLVLGAAFAAYTYAGFSNYLRASMATTLASRADVTADIIRPVLDDPQGLRALMEQRFAPETHDRFIRISVNGQVRYLSGPPAEHGFAPTAIPPIASTEQGLRQVQSLWIYTRQIDLPGGLHATVETGQSGDLMDAARHGLIRSLLIGLPLLLIIAAVGGYGLVRRALAPVTTMIKAAEALTFNSPHNRLPLAGTDDVLDELGRTLNRMLERLDNAYLHASRFSADAAHELRTPLTIMRGELEFVLTSCKVPVEAQTVVASALDETLRLGQIVENLMALSRMDSIAGKREHWPVDVRALAAETIDQMQLLAEEKQIALNCDAGGPVLALGDRDRLKQVLVNLLDNAIKYTPHGGRIWVESRINGNHVLIIVNDSGIGIAPEHQSSVFERFYRVATDRGTNGAGLGLAIVKSICLAHGGTVTVESMPGAGSTFQIILPAATPNSLETLIPTPRVVPKDGSDNAIVRPV